MSNEFDYKQRPFTASVTDEQYDRAVGRTVLCDCGCLNKPHPEHTSSCVCRKPSPPSPKCIGYPRCDGALPGEPHDWPCPLAEKPSPKLRDTHRVKHADNCSCMGCQFGIDSAPVKKPRAKKCKSCHRTEPIHGANCPVLMESLKPSPISPYDLAGMRKASPSGKRGR